MTDLHSSQMDIFQNGDDMLIRTEDNRLILVEDQFVEREAGDWSGNRIEHIVTNDGWLHHDAFNAQQWNETSANGITEGGGALTGGWESNDYHITQAGDYTISDVGNRDRLHLSDVDFDSLSFSAQGDTLYIFTQDGRNITIDGQLTQRAADDWSGNRIEDFVTRDGWFTNEDVTAKLSVATLDLRHMPFGEPHEGAFALDDAIVDNSQAFLATSGALTEATGLTTLVPPLQALSAPLAASAAATSAVGAVTVGVGTMLQLTDNLINGTENHLHPGDEGYRDPNDPGVVAGTLPDVNETSDNSNLTFTFQYNDSERDNDYDSWNDVSDIPDDTYEGPNGPEHWHP